MCEWQKQHLPWNPFEYDGDDPEGYEDFLTVAERGRTEIEEDTCKEHRIFCCEVCFDLAAVGGTSYSDQMEEGEFRCESHNILLCEVCFDWNELL